MVVLCSVCRERHCDVDMANINRKIRAKTLRASRSGLFSAKAHHRITLSPYNVCISCTHRCTHCTLLNDGDVDGGEMARGGRGSGAGGIALLGKAAAGSVGER
jgi:hypothetical protein